MTLLLDILSQILLTIGILFAIVVLFGWIAFLPSVERWMEKVEAKSEKEKEEKKKKKARMKANARKTKKKDLRYLGACGYIAVHGC